MQRLGFIIILLIGAFLSPVVAGTYTLMDGSQVTGDPISYDETGVLFKRSDGSFTDRIDWGRFSDEALRQLRADAKNPQQHALVDPLVSDEAPALKANLREIAVTPVATPERASGRLGIFAIFSSGLGWVMLLILYGANIYAAYEIAVFRNQPAPIVCGLAAIPVFGVGASIYYLATPTRIKPKEEETSSSATPAGYMASSPLPLPSADAAKQTPLPEAAAGSPAQSAAKTAPRNFFQTELPAPIIYRRGEFSFNRRFFETKLTGFFRVVLSEADKDMRIHVNSSRGNFVAKRVSRITQSEIYLEIFKENATAEEMIPFTEVMEVQVRHKDLPA